MTRVLLVTMPFSFANTPSLGLTLLKGAVQRKGFPCDIRYLQLDFTRVIGKDLYYRIAQFAPRMLIGEWIFTHLLFDNQLPGIKDYVNNILSRNGELIDEEFIAQLPVLREQAGEYIESCLQAVSWDDYDVIGFTSTFAQNMSSLALAKRIKESYPNKLIVFGGANCEDEMGMELHHRFPFIDFVCSGESDLLFPALLERLETRSGFKDLSGLIYRDEGQTIANDRFAPAIFDLDQLPYLDFDDYFEQLDEYGLDFSPAEISLPLETSRGCWWGAKTHCTFCGLNDETLVYRSKSEDRVLDEFAYLAHRYPAYRRIDVVDKIMDMRYFRKVIPGLIERQLGLDIFYFVKANLTKQQVKMLKQAGILRIQPGIESLDTGVLQLMRKGTTSLQNIQLLKWTTEVGLDTIWNFITGFPMEDPHAYADMADFLPSIYHLQPPAGGSGQVRLDRFSPFYEDTAAFQMTNVRPTSAYSYIYPFPQENLRRLAYYFDFDYVDGRQPKVYSDVLDRAVERWHQLENPGVLLSMIAQDRLLIYDTRPMRTCTEFELRDYRKAIYEYCDEARTLASIIQYLESDKAVLTGLGEMLFETEDVRNFLGWAVINQLMLERDDRYLSLALPMDEQAGSFLNLFVELFETASEPQRKL